MKATVGALGGKSLEDLSNRKNTQVLKVEHDFVNDPWPVKRVKPVMERIVNEVLSFEKGKNEFEMRKEILSIDDEILAFQRQHPQLFWLITDKEVVRKKSSITALNAMLSVREKEENGSLQREEADAMATSSVIAALSSKK